jgi:hypothetical protein
METITVYRDDYETMRDREFQFSSDFAFLRGTLEALAGMNDAEYVHEQIKKISEKLQSGVDIRSY